MKRKNAGITLVALVITIIILLILAGITISQLTQNGLFEKAKQAKKKSDNAQELENETLAKYENEVSKYLNGSRNETKVSDYKEHLICEYNMNNISGDTIFDNSGNNLNATIVGNDLEQKTDTDERKYIHLNGNTQIMTEEVEQLAGNTEKTIMCMFRTQENTPTYRGIINIGSTKESASGFAPHLNNGCIRFDTGRLTYLYDNQVTFAADNKWHFICATYDKKSIALYFDNKPIYAINATLNTLVPKIMIGAIDQNNTGVYCIGDISDVRVYDKGLNIEEIYSIYTNIKK